VTHGNITNDVWVPSGSFDGENEIASVIRMFVTRNGTTVSRARDSTGFREVYDTVDNEVMSTSWAGTNPTRTGELMMSMRVKGFVARARKGGVGKGRLRETKDVENVDDELVSREGVVRLGAGNDGNPWVSWSTKFSSVTFEDGGEDRGKATGGLLRVSKSLGVGEMLNARSIIRGCSIECLWRHEVWMIGLDKSGENSLRGDDGDVVAVEVRVCGEEVCCGGKDYSIFGCEIVYVFSLGCSTACKHLARIMKALEEGMARRAGVVYTQEIAVDVGMQGGETDVSEASGKTCVEGGMRDRLCSSETQTTLLNGIAHLGDRANVVGIRSPVRREAEVGGNGTHESLITREGESVGEVIGEVACVEKGSKVDTASHHHQVDPAVMKAGDWIESRGDFVGDGSEVFLGISCGTEGEAK
jgi:hypothetical protein